MPESEAIDPSIVMCTDSMVSMEWTGAEHGQKLFGLAHGFMVLTAGPVDRIKELVDLYREAMTEVAPFTRAKALECFRKPLGELKRRFAEGHLQARIGIGYDDFLREGRNQLPPDLFRDLFRDINGFTSGVELIIAGYFGDPHPTPGPFWIDSDSGPAIYRISGDTVSEVEHFACIGAGAVIAESSLYYREHSSGRSIDETFYAVYEAKRLGEKASGVGKRTEMSILKWVNPHGLTYLVMADPSDTLEQHFVRLSPQEINFDGPFLTEGDFFDVSLIARKILNRADAGSSRKRKGAKREH